MYNKIQQKSCAHLWQCRTSHQLGNASYDCTIISSSEFTNYNESEFTTKRTPSLQSFHLHDNILQ